MKLRNPRESPPGGFYFITSDDRKITGSSVRDVWIKSSNYLASNSMDVPGDLIQVIEDQICERLPASYCWRGMGDVVASTIQFGASLVDKVLKTDLVKKAKGCAGCGKRKRKLNSL